MDYGYSFNKNIFTASIDEDGTIYMETNNGRKLIGIDKKSADEMQETIESYYNKLVDVGIFKKELTQQDIMNQMLETMKAMESRIERIEENGLSKNNNKSSGSKDKQVSRGDTKCDKES